MRFSKVDLLRERARSLSGRLPVESFSSARVSVPRSRETRYGLWRAVSRKSWGCRSQVSNVVRQWTQALAATASVSLLALSARGQPTQSATSPSSDRVTFEQSIKEVATVLPQFASGASAMLVRSELTSDEAQAALGFAVALKMHNFAELEERISKNQTISLDEIAAKYYPTAAEYKLVAEWLTSQGFAIKPADKYSLSIFASGTVAQIERVFTAKFGRIKYGGVEYTSALATPSLPVAVAAPVLGINGLQPYLHPRSHFIRVAPSQAMQKLINNQSPYTVPEIAKAYGANSPSASGNGQTIGIVIDTFPNDSDLTAFWQANALNQSLNNIEKIQVVSGTLPSPTGEETLDVEWSSGMASAARVRVYATTDLFSNHLDQAYQQIINDLPGQPELRQVSMSYGLSEIYEPTGQMQTDAQYFATMAAAGVTVFASSGDSGCLDNENDQTVTVEYPASDPSITSVGGTSLYLNSSTGAILNETAWSWNPDYDWGTGGGISGFFSRPFWQTGPGVPTGQTRLVPDVALAADPFTGALIVLNGTREAVGGTSWSSPTWAGICARINQARASVGKASVGLLGPKIYPLIGTASFRDITTGCNGPSGFYNAGPGYDLCTGLGVPSVDVLIGTLATPPTIAKDFNRDGYADLVWENTVTGQRSIWIMKSGVWSSVIDLPTESTQWQIAGVGDFLGTGYADLVWENTVTGQHSIWIMENGVWSSVINLPTEPTQWHVAGAADFLGTGQADLIWENTVTGQHSIWIMENGVWSSVINLSTEPTQWHIAGAADFLGTGQADLVWENTVTGQRSIWIMENGVWSSVLNLPTEPTQWHIAGAADFLGTGQADLVWENTVTGQRSIWIMEDGVWSSVIGLPTEPTQWQIVEH
jgi:kumamolisin